MSSNNPTFAQSAQANPAKRKHLDQDQSQSPLQKQVKLENGGQAPLHPQRNMFNPQGQQGQQGQQQQQQQQQMVYQVQQGGAAQGQPQQQPQQIHQPQQQQQPANLQEAQVNQIRMQILQNLNEEEKKKYSAMLAHAQKIVETHGRGSTEAQQVTTRVNQMTKYYYQLQAQQRAQTQIRNQQGAAAPQAGQNPAAVAAAVARPIAPGTAPAVQNNPQSFHPPPGLSPADLQKWRDNMHNKVKTLVQRLQIIKNQMTQTQAALKAGDGNTPQLRSNLEQLVRQYKVYKDWVDGFRQATALGGNSNDTNQANVTGQAQSGGRVMSIPAAPQDGSNAQGVGAGDGSNVLNKQQPQQKPPQTATSIPAHQQQHQQQHPQAQFQSQQPQIQQAHPQPMTGIEQQNPNSNQQQHVPQVNQHGQQTPQQLPQQQQSPQVSQTPTLGQQGQPNQLAGRVQNRPATAVRSSMSPTTAAQSPQQSPIQPHQSPQMSPQLSQSRTGTQPPNSAVGRSPAPGTPVATQRDQSVPPRAPSTQPTTRPQTATQPQSTQAQQPPPPQRVAGASAQSPPPPPSNSAFLNSRDTSTNQTTAAKMPIPKNLMVPPPNPVANHPIRPSLSGGLNSAGSHVMGAPALVKNPTFEFDEGGMGLLSKRKLEELVKQIDPDEKLDPEVEESVLELVDEFIDTVVTYGCKMAKLRGSDTLDIKDMQTILERNWNIRVPGYAADEIRTVRKFIPAQGYMQKMSALAAGKALNQTTAKGDV